MKTEANLNSTSGYSKRSLIDKLGYQAGQSLWLINPPGWFEDYIKGQVEIVQSTPCAWVHGFFANRQALEDWLAGLDLSQISSGLWVSWPKQQSKIQTDLTEQTFRDLILPLGWVDIKVAAIDETWSGLKFTPRRNN